MHFYSAVAGLRQASAAFHSNWWHAVACGCTCNLARFIVPMLACVRQTQLFHSNAVAFCGMRLHMQPGWSWHIPLCLCWLASGKHSLFTAMLWHAVACGCWRMRLHRQPGTFHSAYAGLRLASAAHSQHCCGMLSYAVALATRRLPCAYAGLRLASAAFSQQCCGLLWNTFACSFFTAMLWQAACVRQVMLLHAGMLSHCSCACNLAHCMVPTLACV